MRYANRFTVDRPKKKEITNYLQAKIKRKLSMEKCWVLMWTKQFHGEFRWLCWGRKYAGELDSFIEFGVSVVKTHEVTLIISGVTIVHVHLLSCIAGRGGGGCLLWHIIAWYKQGIT